jgi:phosphohistidine phosphatase
VKTLMLLRHGKSDWGSDYDGDHERPLAPRGVRAARLMGRYLSALGQAPDAVLSSSAVRARETVRLAGEEGGWNVETRTTEHLYAASPEEVLEQVRECDDAAQCLLLAGHEPTWSMLAGQLVGDGHLRFPTAALARIDLPVTSWSEVEAGRGILMWLVTPKLLQKIGWKGD